MLEPKNGQEVSAEMEGADADSESLESRDESLARVPKVVQFLWVGLAAFGFVDNVFGSIGASFPRHPICSPSSLAWLAFGFVGLIINRLDKVGLPGGGNLSFRKLARFEKAIAKSEISVEALREVLEDYSNLMQNWLHSINLFAEQLEVYAKNDSDVADILARFCLGRMEEAREVVAERGDHTRFSFWWFVEDAGGLKLLFSNDIRDEKTLNHVFKPGAGLLGQCYVEGRIYNLDDAPTSVYYQAVRPEPTYHGLLLVPVRSRNVNRTMGVLSVDREKKETFNENASNVGSALADLIAYAMETALAFEPADAS